MRTQSPSATQASPKDQAEAHFQQAKAQTTYDKVLADCEKSLDLNPLHEGANLLYGWAGYHSHKTLPHSFQYYIALSNVCGRLEEIGEPLDQELFVRVLGNHLNNMIPSHDQTPQSPYEQAQKFRQDHLNSIEPITESYLLYKAFKLFDQGEAYYKRAAQYILTLHQSQNVVNDKQQELILTTFTHLFKLNQQISTAYQYAYQYATLLSKFYEKYSNVLSQHLDKMFMNEVHTYYQKKNPDQQFQDLLIEAENKITEKQWSQAIDILSNANHTNQNKMAERNQKLAYVYCERAMQAYREQHNKWYIFVIQDYEKAIDLNPNLAEKSNPQLKNVATAYATLATSIVTTHWGAANLNHRERIECLYNFFMAINYSSYYKDDINTRTYIENVVLTLAFVAEDNLTDEFYKLKEMPAAKLISEAAQKKLDEIYQSISSYYYTNHAKPTDYSNAQRIQGYEIAIKFNSEDVKLHFELGKLYLIDFLCTLHYYLGIKPATHPSIKKAIECFTNTTRLSPDNLHAHVYLAVIHIIVRENTEEGLPYLQKMLDLFPNSPCLKATASLMQLSLPEYAYGSNLTEQQAHTLESAIQRENTHSVLKGYAKTILQQMHERNITLAIAIGNLAHVYIYRHKLSKILTPSIDWKSTPLDVSDEALNRDLLKLEEIAIKQYQTSHSSISFYATVLELAPHCSAEDALKLYQALKTESQNINFNLHNDIEKKINQYLEEHTSPDSKLLANFPEQLQKILNTSSTETSKSALLNTAYQLSFTQLFTQTPTQDNYNNIVTVYEEKKTSIAKEDQSMLTNIAGAYHLMAKKFLSQSKYQQWFYYAGQSALLSKSHAELFKNDLIEFNLTNTYLKYGEDQLKKNPQQAIPVFTILASFSPSDSNYFKLGEAYRRTKQYQAAKENYEKAIQINLECFTAYCGRGMVYLTENQLDEAEKDYLRAYQLNSEAPLVNEKLGVIYLKKEDHHKAIHCFNKVLETNPQHTNALLQLVDIYYARQAWEFVIDCFENLSREEFKKQLNNPKRMKAIEEVHKRKALNPEQTLEPQPQSSNTEFSVVQHMQNIWASFFTSPENSAQTTTTFPQPTAEAKPELKKDAQQSISEVEQPSQATIQTAELAELLMRANSIYDKIIDEAAQGDQSSAIVPTHTNAAPISITSTQEPTREEQLLTAVSLYKEALQINPKLGADIHPKLMQIEKELGDYYFTLNFSSEDKRPSLHKAIKFYTEAIAHPETTLNDKQPIIRSLTETHLNKAKDYLNSHKLNFALEHYAKALQASIQDELITQSVHEQLNNSSISKEQLFKMIVGLEEEIQFQLLVAILSKKSPLAQKFWKEASGSTDQERIKNGILNQIYQRLIELKPDNNINLAYQQNTIYDISILPKTVNEKYLTQSEYLKNKF